MISTNLPVEVTQSPIQSPATSSFQALLLAGFASSFGLSAIGWPTANNAIYIPVRVYEERTVKRIMVRIGTATNFDVGIYNSAFSRLVSAGSTVAVGSSFQIVDIADTVLSPGLHYIGLSFDTAGGAETQGINSTNYPQYSFGVRKQATAFPLPATATPADATETWLPFVVLLDF